MHAQRLILIVGLVIAIAFLWLRGAFVGITDSLSVRGNGTTVAETTENPAPSVAAAVPLPPADVPRSDGYLVATFASGCFWCTEADFDKLPGVVSTTSGYTGGRVPNPTYRQVSSGATGHAEAVQVVFDPAVVTYERLLEQYWHNVDPFTAHRQFCDVGDQYRPEIFVHSEAQRTAAEASKARMQGSFSQPIVVKITAAPTFYRAEEYHQDYHTRNSAQYRFYRYGCGRDSRLDEIWGR